jgi:hypothetical protein
MALVIFSSFWFVYFVCYESERNCQCGNEISVAGVCRIISCILQHPKLTTVMFDHEPSACIGHDAWNSEGLAVPPADVLAKGWAVVLKFLRAGDEVHNFMSDVRDELADPIAKVKMGSDCFVNTEEILATGRRVSNADCVTLGARMSAGELDSVKMLKLVRMFCFFDFSIVLYLCLFCSSCRLQFVSGNMRGAGWQPNWQRGCKSNCSSSQSQH